jgi:hypothetical protein
MDRLFVEEEQVDTSGRLYPPKLQWDVVRRAAEQRISV